MASKGGAAPSTYTPAPTNKTRRPPFFPDSDVDWLRSDGRGFHQCRPAFFQTGAVNSAAGSAYAESGKTKVIVSVFGPKESKKAMMYSDTGRLNCNVSYTTFATTVRGHGSENKEFSTMLHKALEGAIVLESFPKTTVDVFALVLESGGSDLPVAISCASLALADAGITMYDLVAGASVSCLGRNLIIDPNFLTITGKWSTANLNEAMQLCLDACSKLAKIMRSCLKEAASASKD
ncbi:hypothetical protein OIU78_001507 [Salix suchowensis]|nr:hypothetical protein OIU78_001507 [Salix suchowensis]